MPRLIGLFNHEKIVIDGTKPFYYLNVWHSLIRTFSVQKSGAFFILSFRFRIWERDFIIIMQGHTYFS